MDFLIPLLNTIALGLGAVLLLIGVASAPWQVLLLLLALGWLLTQRWLQQVNGGVPLSQTSTPLTPEPMSGVQSFMAPPDQLIYRGAVYRSNSSSNVVEQKPQA